MSYSALLKKNRKIPNFENSKNFIFLKKIFFHLRTLEFCIFLFLRPRTHQGGHFNNRNLCRNSHTSGARIFRKFGNSKKQTSKKRILWFIKKIFLIALWTLLDADFDFHIHFPLSKKSGQNRKFIFLCTNIELRNAKRELEDKENKVSFSFLRK